MSFTVAQKAVGSISPKTDDGKDAKVSNIAWTVDKPDVASINPSADGLSAELVGKTAGTVVVTVSAVNVEGATLTESVTDNVTELVAKTLGLSFAAPVAQ